MKKLITTIIVLLMLSFVTACEDDNKNLSSVETIRSPERMPGINRPLQ
ncbi:MAG: hypothetical protein GY795_40730 [Desulfobacterales bacterium]|nr:hypothetical protein [Desulfobacterales bacterium]